MATAFNLQFEPTGIGIIKCLRFNPETGAKQHRDLEYTLSNAKDFLKLWSHNPAAFMMTEAELQELETAIQLEEETKS